MGSPAHAGPGHSRRLFPSLDYGQAPDSRMDAATPDIGGQLKQRVFAGAAAPCGGRALRADGCPGTLHPQLCPASSAGPGYLWGPPGRLMYVSTFPARTGNPVASASPTSAWPLMREERAGHAVGPASPVRVLNPRTWKHLHEVLDKLSALGLVINKKAQKGEEQGSSLVNARVSRPVAYPLTPQHGREPPRGSPLWTS